MVEPWPVALTNFCGVNTLKLLTWCQPAENVTVCFQEPVWAGWDTALPKQLLGQWAPRRRGEQWLLRDSQGHPPHKHTFLLWLILTFSTLLGPGATGPEGFKVFPSHMTFRNLSTDSSVLEEIVAMACLISKGGIPGKHSQFNSQLKPCFSYFFPYSIVHHLFPSSLIFSIHLVLIFLIQHKIHRHPKLSGSKGAG